jgi:hypothetical protein
MTPNRKPIGAVTVAVAALSVFAPVARVDAQVLPAMPVAPFSPLAPAVQAPVNGSASSGSCTHDRHNSGPVGFGGDGQGRTGGTEDVQCQGAGLQFIGPGIGQVAVVMGPTVIGSTINAPVQTSAGSAATNFSG